MIRKFLISTLIILSIGKPIQVHALDITKLPKYVQDSISTYKVQVVPSIREVPGYEEKDKRVIGTVNYERKELLVKDRDTDLEEEQIFYHEVGHILDNVWEVDGTRHNGKYSETTEFRKCYKLERKNSDDYSNYTSTDLNEYFVESFAYYHTNPEMLRNKCPFTFHYIEAVIYSLSNTNV